MIAPELPDFQEGVTPPVYAPSPFKSSPVQASVASIGGHHGHCENTAVPQACAGDWYKATYESPYVQFVRFAAFGDSGVVYSENDVTEVEVGVLTWHFSCSRARRSFRALL